MHTNARAIISPVFAVTDPTAFPMAMSALPCAAASRDTSSSGMVVARETMVAPMMNFGMPDTSAIQLAASTNRSPPLTVSTMPNTNSATVPQISIQHLPFGGKEKETFPRNFMHG